MKQFSIVLICALQFGLAACDSSSSSSNQPPVIQQPIPEISPTPIPSVTPTPEPKPGEGENKPTTGLGLQAGLTVDRQQFLQNIGNGVAGLTNSFQVASEQLQAGVQVYCTKRDAASMEALHTQFADAMLVWQKLEMFQMGPLAENNKTLKVKIYGWPQLANYCKIDEEALLAREDPDYSLSSNTNRKGLQALEYLIFNDSLITNCPAANPVKAEWEALSTDQKWAARCAYMQPVSAELVDNARLLASKWGRVDNNVLTLKLGQPAAEQAALQELFDGLFYLDLEVKNQKLAAPAGQDTKYCNKSPSPCPDKEELRYSHLSREALSANFRALADIMFGFGNPRTGGLSALLRHEGGAAVADHSETVVSELVNASENQTASLDGLVSAKASENCETSQISWLCQVRQSIRTVIGDFKGEYASILKTTVPAAPQGDND